MGVGDAVPKRLNAQLGGNFSNSHRMVSIMNHDHVRRKRGPGANRARAVPQRTIPVNPHRSFWSPTTFTRGCREGLLIRVTLPPLLSAVNDTSIVLKS